MLPFCGQVEDLADEVFAARHLRYEIYEKKQIQPLLNQRRRNRSNRSESEQSLTASVSANPQSPDVSNIASSEAAGESVFGFPTSGEATADSEAAACSLREQPQTLMVPTVDVRLYRVSPATLAALAQTMSHCTETSQTDHRTVVAADACKDSLWPERSFPLVGAECDRMRETESSGDSCCDASISVSAGLTVSEDSSVPVTDRPAETTDNADGTKVAPN